MRLEPLPYKRAQSTTAMTISSDIVTSTHSLSFLRLCKFLPRAIQ
jgi:hypothetical protein